jgi:hypothetical protein
MSKGESKRSEWRSNVYQPSKTDRGYTPVSEGGKVIPHKAAQAPPPSRAAVVVEAAMAAVDRVARAPPERDLWRLSSVAVELDRLRLSAITRVFALGLQEVQELVREARRLLQRLDVATGHIPRLRAETVRQPLQRLACLTRGIGCRPD